MEKVLVVTHPELGAVAAFSSMENLVLWGNRHDYTGDQQDVISKLESEDYEIEWAKLDNMD